MRFLQTICFSASILCAQFIWAEEADALSHLKAIAKRCEELSKYGATAQDTQNELHPSRWDLASFNELCNWNEEAKLYNKPLPGIPPHAFSNWPKKADAPQLRELLKHSDPAIRALAVGALASLDFPEDVDAIGALLKDDARSGPWLAPCMMHVRANFTHQLDSPVAMVQWTTESINEIARDALFRMTGERFNAVDFEQWRARNSDPQNCLWYWQRCLEREKKELDEASSRVHEDRTQREQRLAQWRAAWLEKLRALPPEVELKVRLLAVDPHGTSAEITHPTGVFFTEPIQPRVPTERLLELLEERNLWTDVNWKENRHFNRMAERLLLTTPALFKPEHAPRLKAIWENHSQQLWWSGPAAFYIGISRLLPPCGENRDDFNSREGWLRKGIRAERDVFTRGYILRELINVGLPREFEFISEQFFKDEKTSAIPNIQQSILQGLSTAPLNKEKLQVLVKLLQDPRCEGGWTRELKVMGDDGFQMRAVEAVNLYAGKELISYEERQALRSPASAAKAYPIILEKIKTLQ